MQWLWMPWVVHFQAQANPREGTSSPDLSRRGGTAFLQSWEESVLDASGSASGREEGQGSLEGACAPPVLVHESKPVAGCSGKWWQHLPLVVARV